MVGARSRAHSTRTTIGWREWVALPDLGVEAIKVKVDTGARTSSLHAHRIEIFERDGSRFVSFQVHPEQRRKLPSIDVVAPLHDLRSVRSSSGEAEERPVILTSLGLLDVAWKAELTLTRRDAMGFRMLLGRQAIRERFLVDPGRSFLGGKRRRVKPAGD